MINVKLRIFSHLVTDLVSRSNEDHVKDFILVLEKKTNDITLANLKSKCHTWLGVYPLKMGVSFGWSYKN